MFCMDNTAQQQQQWEFGDQISHLSTLISSPLLGRVIDGVVVNSDLGQSLSTAVDFNADGLSDVLIGAAWWNSNQGKAFVVFGKAKSQAITPLFLTTLSSNTAIEFVGESGSWFGYSVSSGDWNSDGFVDLLIGAFGYSSYAGATYMIFGHNGTWVTSTSASGVGTSVSGVKVIGDSYSESGWSVSNGGDVNADSIDDFIIGGPTASPQGRHMQEEHGLCLEGTKQVIGQG